VIGRELFRHATTVQVRNYEIDWQGIVHNAIYLHYFETGRINYLQSLGINVDINAIQHDTRVVVARNEIDYRSPARFGDALTVFTRIAELGKTSFTFEGLIEEERTRRVVAENRSVHVWLDPVEHRPMDLPVFFVNRVMGFEGSNCTIRPK